MRRTRRPRGEHGAAAVEFALVTFAFMPLLFGMLQYGLYFNDSLSVRQGLREGARSGVVQAYDSSCTGTSMEKIRCATKSSMGFVSGDVAVKVAAPDGWARGKPLVVCAMAASAARGIAFLPMPDDGYVAAKTRMSIEVGSPVPAELTAADPALTSDWSWC